ncbi:Na+/H+ antiporter subunit D [Acanthopleuribacter pedis]|uniref:Na+/H+ antiporter subunit D n=1 Tax=Acanthopleuribacter pedis TaxID=442870 RepID=A0A8J7QR93_9BACT|nr:Na+/H+ antiporter subunit D [Acanthopleuribacter pedis]MBO1322750.1 Na+/H+ antiporter subunit D [Acanthopleuribacter pedis]
MNLLVLPVMIPLITALLLLFCQKNRRLAQIVSTIGAFSLPAVGLLILSRVHEEGIQVIHMGSWQAPFGITLVADYLSALMLSVCGLVGAAVAVFALKEDMNLSREGVFFPLLHALLMGVNGSFLAGDMFNLYVWFEVMLISSFVLLSLGKTNAQLLASIKYVALNLVSSAIFLTGLGLLYGKTGTLNMADLAVQLQNTESTVLLTSTALFFLVAFSIKAACFPFFFWLPPAYPAAPAPIAAIFSGLLTKVGVYALFRTFTLIFNQDTAIFQPILYWMAILTMVTGVLGAVAQMDIKKILSYHIISQIGYMIIGLALATKLALAGAIFYLVHHIVVKTNLFLLAGAIEKSGGTNDLKKLGGYYKGYPLLAVMFLVPALSLAGIPPLSGFFSKLFLIRASLENGDMFMAFMALAVGVFTLISMTKIWMEAFWKKGVGENERRPAKIKRLDLTVTMPIAVLAVVTVVIGFSAGHVFHFAELAAEQLIAPQMYIDAVMGGNAR